MQYNSFYFTVDGIFTVLTIRLLKFLKISLSLSGVHVLSNSSNVIDSS